MADALIASLIGGLVGAGELLARYRSDPKRLLRAFSAWLYVLMNAGASCGALALIHGFNWTFGAETVEGQRLTQVLVAGFGAVALFRTSLFVTRIGNQDIGIGPSTVLTVFLNTIDGEVDRVQAEDRSKIVSKAMNGLSFERSYVALPTYCLALMQNVSHDNQEVLGAAIAKLRNTDMDDDLKCLSLGLELMNVVGPRVLEAAVDAIGYRLRAEVQDADEEKKRVSETITSLARDQDVEAKIAAASVDDTTISGQSEDRSMQLDRESILDLPTSESRLSADTAFVDRPGGGRREPGKTRRARQQRPPP
jgi:hypothetical protein